MPTVGSLFSGIGGFDLGMERAGWRVIWQVETNPFRRRILKRHWPNVELRGDIATDTDGLEAPDLICGGFPCQDVSVAGNRAGLAGERSGLWYEYLRVVRELRPAWVLIENVPGLLSSHEGEDFEVIVQGLAECRYGMAWRVLDSQNWGVPQRRRRVFIVGHLGAPCPIEVLFEPEGGGGDSEAGRTQGEEIAGTLGGGSGGRGWRNDLDNSGAYIPERAFALTTESGRHTGTDWSRNYIPERGRSLTGASGQRWDGDSETFVVNARQNPIVGKPTLDTDGYSHAVVQGNIVAQTLLGSGGHDGSPDPDRHSLVVGPTPDTDGVRETPGVPRRLDPAAPDGPRYAALGDAVTVPVIEWIGRRILVAHMKEGRRSADLPRRTI